VIVLLTSLLQKEGEEGLPHRYLSVALIFFDRNIVREAPTVPKKLLPKNKPHKIVQKGNCPKKTLKRSIYLYKAK
jgi:hypothetical protein